MSLTSSSKSSCHRLLPGGFDHPVWLITPAFYNKLLHVSVKLCRIILHTFCITCVYRC